ncbi:conserved hypothetical protein [Pseudomonas sp. 8Z]|uniref:DUF1090 domain-containing protein n=1 Tax=Pseudomonas sp. 8Z TaxID=2653166 RepID=UPI0012F0090B|nr:DUF1090 domain-containing protein [Pseudomonas sp. 8Z]VXC08855.1 conserved hypothetical protein [Pseudomonas sp. 8Z]
MIRQAAVLGLLLIAGLNVTPPLVAEADKGCDSTRQVLQKKIASARLQGDTAELEGLHQAQKNVDAYCRGAQLQKERLANVEQAREAVEQREMALRGAIAQDDPQMIAKDQAKLAEAREEQAQSEDQARHAQ